MKLVNLMNCAAWLLFAGAFAVVGQESAADPGFDFKGRLLVSVSDADMVPSAYIDGNLGAVDGADALSVIRLDRPLRELKAIEIPASNSVTGPPSALAVTPNGKYAIVIETLGRRTAGRSDQKLKDLPLGRTITVVDLSNPDRPRVSQQIEGFRQPVAVAINYNSTLVAVSYRPSGDGKTTPLAVYRFQNGKLSAPLVPQIPGWTVGDSLSHVEFHPTQNILALVNETKPTLSFVRVSENGSGITLAPWGNTIQVEFNPFQMRFTPNGRCAIINSAYTGAAITGPGSYFFSPRGSVQSIRLAADTAADGAPIHRMIARASTGFIPEGLNISPDGRWIVTTNLENSAFAPNDPRQEFFSSLTLLRLDSENGFLNRVGDFAFDGVLPETAVFDNSSRYLAVTNFTYFDQQQKGGLIDFWRLVESRTDPQRVELVKTNYSVPVTRGVHTMKIVR
ncbi:hypothetical protein [Nostoc sp.]|uniref:hypothetical protein n=1 Tax=Nostoc sp. TaxID=1180 RepID=UPI002FF45123